MRSVLMADTHIHIHLNGDSSPSKVAAETLLSSPKRIKKISKATSPPKPKRAVSAYHKTVGSEMKKLKKANFRGNVMKRAHANAKKIHSKKRGKK